MNYEAYDLGRAAFAAGKKRIPMYDAALATYLKVVSVGNNVKAANAALKDWLEGWDEANLAAPVTEKAKMRALMDAVAPPSDLKKYAVKLMGEKIGTVWEEGGEWHSEHSDTGMSWAIDDKYHAIKIVVDHHRQHVRHAAYLKKTAVKENEDWNFDSSSDEGNVAVCPKCKSPNVSTQLHPTISPSTTQLVCDDCGYQEHIPVAEAEITEDANTVKSSGELVLHMFKDVMLLRNHARTELSDLQYGQQKKLLNPDEAVDSYRSLVDELNQIVEKYSKTKVK